MFKISEVICAPQPPGLGQINIKILHEIIIHILIETSKYLQELITKCLREHTTEFLMNNDVTYY
jgi:hypothetical protein